MEILRIRPGPTGSKGGRLIRYSNVGRHLNNSDFATLVGKAWIGTIAEQSRLIKGLIKDIYLYGKAVVSAIKSVKDRPVKIYDEDDNESDDAYSNVETRQEDEADR